MHTQQWTNTLATYAYPILGALCPADIGTDLVRKVLEPIWLTKNETATRLRGRSFPSFFNGTPESVVPLI
ncbi:integrase [Burkholderia pseudomallei]|nr:integrase [Burkholderia pseudomallei]